MVNAKKKRLERFDLRLFTRMIKKSNGRSPVRIDLWTKNISAKGAFFETDQKFSVGNKLEMEIYLTPRTTNTHIFNIVLIKGTVSRVEATGMAVCFSKKFRFAPQFK